MMNKNQSFRRKVHLLPPFIPLSLTLLPFIPLSLTLPPFIPLAPSKRILITTSHSCGSEYYTSYVVSQETRERKFFQKEAGGSVRKKVLFQSSFFPFPQTFEALLEKCKKSNLPFL